MSIQSQIDRISQNVASTYGAAAALGATMPAAQNSDNLPATVASIPSGGGNGGAQVVKLWENSAPTSAFEAQTIALDLSEFDAISIYFKNKNNSTVYLSTGIIPVGGEFTLFYITSDPASQRRAGSVSASGVTFATGYAASSASTACAIPVIIYGWKFYTSRSIISVTYPAGSVCTCSYGGTVLTAPDTSGVWIFNPPSVGAWTLACTDGTDSDSKIVTIISAVGQTEVVALSYRIVLFDGGDNTAITGGWESGSSFSDTIEVDDTIYANISGTSSSYTYRALCKTVNMIQMDTCNQLEIVIDDVTKKNTTNSWTFGVFETITSSKPDYIASITFDTAGTYVLDVSGLSGGYYVGFSCGFIGAGSGRSMAMTASKITSA